MGEETSDADANAMNLDLNLGADTEPLSGTVANEDIILDDWFDVTFNRIRETMRQQRLRQQFLRASDHGDLHDRWPHPRDTISLELDELLENSGNGSVLQAGEGSVATEERAAEVPKACEISNGGVALDETSEKKEDVEKCGGGGDAGFFDCNICFDMAKDPVVTCCGHLFCWPCLYKWLHLQSHTKKGCPVCKGEVNVKSVIPIYGRGNDVRVHEEEDSNLKIPLRPTAIRLESRLDLNREIVQSHEHANASQAAEITSVSNRHFGGRAFRRVQNLGLQRTQGNRVTFPSTLNSADRLTRLIDGYSPGNPIGRNQEQPPSFNSADRLARLIDGYSPGNPIGGNQEQPPSDEDRDSFSSIAAVINSESQVDTAAEIDSMVSLSTSSSSRSRNGASRVSDRNSGDFRAPKRRRLN